MVPSLGILMVTIELRNYTSKVSNGHSNTLDNVHLQTASITTLKESSCVANRGKYNKPTRFTTSDTVHICATSRIRNYTKYCVYVLHLKFGDKFMVQKKDLNRIQA